ncbi:MAG: YdcF family protein [Chitinophagales bacterium]|nr:YdcF family protein [Chitinophagales bacterium]
MKKILFVVGLVIITIIAICNFLVVKNARHAVFDQTAEIPINKVGLLLGTSKLLSNGQPNLYFEYRIRAATDLFKAKKISKLIVSGDNSRKDYNEPGDMKAELIKRGIPDSVIFLDCAGFSTYESLYRLKAVFLQDSCTIISQKFHNERAIYIARHLGINAIGYNAREVVVWNGLKTKAREKLARVKCVMDIWQKKTPTHLGAPIKIGE